MPQAAAIYVRISSDRDAEGHGVARQEQMCKELADRNGWTVAEVYTDNDLSAFDGSERPAFDRLMDDLEDGVRDAVVVADLDRLTRDPRQGEDFIDLADRRGVSLDNVAGQVDLSTPMGRMVFRQQMAWARAESEQKSERVRRERAQRARKGLPHPGPRRFGWNDDMDALVDREADAVREAAEQLLSGASYRSIADDWNDAGLETTQGNRFSTEAVRAIMLNPRIAGLRVHRGEVVGEGVWPKIVDRATFERLKTARTSKHSYAGRPAIHLLTGLLVCGRCGNGLVSAGTMGATTRSYACRRQPGKRDDACGRRQIVASHSEDWIVEAVLHRLATEDLADLVAARQAERSEVAALTDELEAAEDRLAEIAELFGDGQIDRAAYMRARDAAEDRREQARRGLEDATGGSPVADAPSDHDELDEWWQQLDVDRQRAVLQAVLDRVELLEFDESGPRRFQHDRLEPHWKV